MGDRLARQLWSNSIILLGASLGMYAGVLMARMFEDEWWWMPLPILAGSLLYFWACICRMGQLDGGMA